MPQELWSSGGASLHARLSLAARGFTHRRWQCPEMGGPWTFSPPPFSTGGDLQRNIKSQKPVDFSCFSLFSDLLFPSLFSNLPNLELGITRAADRPSVWMAGSATSLFLLHFYTGGVVHRCHGWEIGAPFKSCSSALRPPSLFLRLLCDALLLAAEKKGE